MSDVSGGPGARGAQLVRGGGREAEDGEVGAGRARLYATGPPTNGDIMGGGSSLARLGREVEVSCPTRRSETATMSAGG
jgi:hypothetical protein